MGKPLIGLSANVIDSHGAAGTLFLLPRSAYVVLLPLILFIDCFVVNAGNTCDYETGVFPTDTLTLGEVEVTGYGGGKARIAADGSVNLGISALGTVPRMFGEADYLRYIRTLPGIASASDYASGVSVDGNGYSQNMFRLNGIPVHFPYHFGGIFSVFSPSVYRNVHIEKSIHKSSSPNMLGGIIDFYGNPLPGRATGEVNVGMLASSVFASMPLWKGFSIAVSGRISYIDMLYGSLISSGNDETSYGLGDVDVVADYVASERDIFRFTFHQNADRLKNRNRESSMICSMDWRNLLAGLEWIHDADNFSTCNRVYYSGFENSLHLDMQQITMDVPTSIREIGAEGAFVFPVSLWKSEVDAGYAVSYAACRPQGAEVSGFGNAGSTLRDASDSFSTRIYGDISFTPNNRCSVTAGGVLNGFYAPAGKAYVYFDPRVTVGWRTSNMAFSVHTGRYHQYFHQVGFSEIGLASNFKIQASDVIPPGRAWNLSAGVGWYPGYGLTVSADVYRKWMKNQPEYIGAVLDLVNPGYRAENYIRLCNGYNTGGSLSVGYAGTRVMAMASYSMTVADRFFHSESYKFPASNELRHAATVSASWVIDRHWSLNALFSIASGRPITPVSAIYFIGEKLMMEYGIRNSSRLPATHRLDIGASYEFSIKGKFPLQHRVCLSVLNAYGHNNVEMSTFTLDAATGRYYNREIGSLYNVLPSISYTLKY